ncbi:MAG: GNAT family N-acetyltransferase, partial [Acidobacteria bacterium]|nr:GNAT family N-acetyltransferase [Acidobacteriota bacterium]
MLASTVTWAVYTVLGRATLRTLGSRRATAAAMLFGWAMLAPFFVWVAGWQEYTALSSTGALAIAFLGIGCSGLGYLFWYAALERLEASQVAAFLYAEPLFTLWAAVAFLGESVASSTILGGVLVLVGVAAVQTTRERQSDPRGIVAVSPGSPEACELIAELDAELYVRYPALPVHGLSASDVLDPDTIFLVARVDGTAVACGALRRLGPDTSEVKRMYVRPAFRGRGLARRILAELEET